MSFLNLMRNKLKPKEVNEALTKAVQKEPPDFSSSDEGKVLKVNSSGELEWAEDSGGLPSYSSSDEGKLLSVDSAGELEWRDESIELPTYSSFDENKVLSVDSSGELEWRDENVELPAYSSSDENKVLGVGSSGELEWKEESTYTPPAYSTTEFNTGVKWIDGKDIYCRCVPLSELSTNIFQNPSVTTLTDVDYIDTLIYGAVTGQHASTGIKYILPLEISLATDGTLKTGDPFETVNFVNGSAYFIMQYTKVTASKSKKTVTKNK